MMSLNNGLESKRLDISRVVASVLNQIVERNDEVSITDAVGTVAFY